MTPDARIIDEYVEEAEFARANSISTRTSARLSVVRDFETGGILI